MALLFAKGSFYNAGHAEPDGLADALAKTRLVDGEQERKAALALAQKILADNALFVPTVFEPGLAVHSREVNGFRLNLLGKAKFTEVSLAPA